MKIEKVIIFNNIKLNLFTIHFLRIKNYDYSIVGVFSNEINYQLSKLILFHIYVSIINLKNKINFEINEQIFFNLYYECILFPLIKNFEIKCNEIFKKKSINIINNFEYNTTLLIDLNTKKILINLISLRSDKKNFKIQNESQMFIEILYHSTNIQIEYNNENQNSINLNLDKFYVKFDCRSTYPRQTYIIRFIPFLNGLSLVHVFTQNKLSRPQDCIKNNNNNNNNNVNNNNVNNNNNNVKCNSHRNSKNNNKIKLKNIDDINNNKRRNSENNNNNKIKNNNNNNYIKSTFNNNNNIKNNNDNIKLITSTNNTNKNFGAPNISIDNSISNLNNCYYKDINVIYGYEFFEQKQIFLDNKESLFPEQIKIIENFIIEYFIVLNYDKEDYYQTNINYNLKYLDNKIIKNIFDEEIYNKYKNNFNENFYNEIKKKLIINLCEEISNEKNNFLRNNNNNNLFNNIYRKDSNNSTNENLYLLNYKNYLSYLKEFCKKFNRNFDYEDENNKENNNNNNEEENLKINNEIINENSFINRKDSLNIFRKESLNSNFDGSIFSLDISNSMVKNNNVINKNLLSNLNLNNVNSNDLNELFKLNLTNIKNTEDSMIENNSMMIDKKNNNNK